MSSVCDQIGLSLGGGGGGGGAPPYFGIVGWFLSYDPFFEIFVYPTGFLFYATT